MERRVLCTKKTLARRVQDIVSPANRVMDSVSFSWNDVYQCQMLNTLTETRDLGTTETEKGIPSLLLGGK